MQNEDRARLLVEGSDDFHVIRELLFRHGIAYDKQPWSPFIETAGPGHNKNDLLRTVVPAINASEGQPIGFVLDANASAQKTWKDISREVAKAGVRAPEKIPREGFFGHSEFNETLVGIWVMPDNERDGALEGFLEASVPADDTVFAYARHVAREAKKRGAKFAEKDEHKATMHTWLAWQRTPGRQYGTAVQAQFFDAHSEVAQRFMAWFLRLYEPTDPLVS